MRFVTFAALAALAMPMPALAQDAEPPLDPDAVAGETLTHVARAMSDPDTQKQVAAMAGAMIRAIEDMPVGSMMRAAETMAGGDPEAVDPDLRLADVAGEEGLPDEAELAERIPQMMSTMAAMTYALDGVLPELRKTMEAAAKEMRETAH